MKFNRQRAFHSHFGTDHPARMRALRRHRDDLFDRSSSASPTRLPLCKSAPSTTPLESTHLQVLIPHHFISFRINTYKKPGGGSPLSSPQVLQLVTPAPHYSPRAIHSSLAGPVAPSNHVRYSESSSMNYGTLPSRLLNAVDSLSNPRAQMFRAPEGWQSISSEEFLRRVASLSTAFVELGVKPGDRVGLFATNRPEWHTADFAITGAGGVTVPVYFNESPDRMAASAGLIALLGDESVRRTALADDAIWQLA